MTFEDFCKWILVPVLTLDVTICVVCIAVQIWRSDL